MFFIYIYLNYIYILYLGHQIKQKMANCFICENRYGIIIT